MKVHCISPNNSAVTDLAEQLGLHPAIVAAKVAVWQDKNGLKKWPTVEQLSNKVVQQGKVDKPQGLLYAETRLPALWKELFDDPYFMGANGDIDFNKVNDMLPELMDMLGYRIPNEDKYSSLPLKVIGFLPSGSGGAIMLPAEITTISGSDFDVDKMYAMVKKLIRNNGGLQIEKYLDDTNSTSKERKESYVNRLPEAKKVRLNYKDRLQTIKDEISQTKIDNNDLKELKLKSKDLAEQWNDIQDEIESLDTPTTVTTGMYRVLGITDLETYKDGLNKEFETIKKEHKVVNTQISELQEKGIVESDNVTTSKLQDLYNRKTELYTQRQEEINNLISDEEFNKLSIPQQNTKGARDNERLDVFMGIYTNPHTAKDIMTPGGYETVRKISESINKHKTVPKDVFGMESMDALTIQNIQGRNLKGIAVSHNAFAAKSQHSNLKLSFPVLFDGKSLDSLSGTISESVNGDKVNITRNFAEIVAASVDNGKDPLLASINYNQHAADVISMLLRTGADINTVFAFMNQPIILNAMELVNLGEQRDLLTALKSIAKEMKVSSQFDKIDITNFNQKDLVDMLHGSDNSVSQSKILQNMIKYMIASKDYSNLISATKSDTKGIGKFMEEGITLMRNTQKALQLKTITGTKEFLLNEGVNEGVKDQRFNNMFYKYGVQTPIDEVMSKIYPYANESFSGVKDIIEQQLGYNLTAEEAKLVDQMLVQFHTSKFDWYSNEDKNNIVKNLPEVITMLGADYSEFIQSDLVKPLFNALVVGKDVSMGMNSITFDNTQTASDEQREDIKKAWSSLSSPYSEQLLTERLLKDNLLTPEELNSLQISDDGKSFYNLKAIQTIKKLDKFNNPELQQLIQDYLFDRFSNNLIRYSFFTTGLNFTPKSISGLIPISAYTGIKYNNTNLVDYIYNIQNIGNIGTSTEINIDGSEFTYAETGSDAETFTDQFYRHMYSNQKFVPRVSFSQYDKTGENNVTSVDDLRITIIPEMTTNSELYEYKDDYLVAKNDYISVKIEGKYKLYKNVLSGSNGELIFERIGLLGVPKLIYEFDHNNTGRSIIENNNVNSIGDTGVLATGEEVEQRIKDCK